MTGLSSRWRRDTELMDKLTTERADLLEAGRLDDLCKAARNSERRRAHLLLHSGHQDQVQRLVTRSSPGPMCALTNTPSSGRCSSCCVGVSMSSC